MQTYLFIAQIVIAIALILALLLQVRGGGLGGIFGQPDAVFRTKRGIEKTLFQLTIILVVLFVIVSVVALKAGSAQ
ncbi:MAG: preprotein translocase subunit SecG [Chloroflexota bacterium]